MYIIVFKCTTSLHIVCLFFFFWCFLLWVGFWGSKISYLKSYKKPFGKCPFSFGAYFSDTGIPKDTNLVFKLNKFTN